MKSCCMRGRSIGVTVSTMYFFSIVYVVTLTSELLVLHPVLKYRARYRLVGLSLCVIFKDTSLRVSCSNCWWPSIHSSYCHMIEILTLISCSTVSSSYLASHLINVHLIGYSLLLLQLSTFHLNFCTLCWVMTIIFNLNFLTISGNFNFMFIWLSILRRICLLSNGGDCWNETSSWVFGINNRFTTSRLSASVCSCRWLTLDNRPWFLRASLLLRITSLLQFLSAASWGFVLPSNTLLLIIICIICIVLRVLSLFLNHGLNKFLILKFSIQLHVLCWCINTLSICLGALRSIYSPVTWLNFSTYSIHLCMYV